MCATYFSLSYRLHTELHHFLNLFNFEFNFQIKLDQCGARGAPLNI